MISQIALPSSYCNDKMSVEAVPDHNWTFQLNLSLQRTGAADKDSIASRSYIDVVLPEIESGMCAAESRHRNDHRLERMGNFITDLLAIFAQRPAYGMQNCQIAYASAETTKEQRAGEQGNFSQALRLDCNERPLGASNIYEDPAARYSELARFHSPTIVRLA